MTPPPEELKQEKTHKNPECFRETVARILSRCILDLRCQPNEHIWVYISHSSISTVILIESVRPMTPLAPDPANILPSASESVLQLYGIRTFFLPAIIYELNQSYSQLQISRLVWIWRGSNAYISYLYWVVAWNQIVACITVRHKFPKFEKPERERRETKCTTSMINTNWINLSIVSFGTTNNKHINSPTKTNVMFALTIFDDDFDDGKQKTLASQPTHCDPSSIYDLMINISRCCF